MQCRRCAKQLTPVQIRLGGVFCSKWCFGEAYSDARRAHNVSKAALKEFWARVDKRGRAECWLWLGAVHGDDFPYGIFKRRGVSRQYAHQIAYEATFGSIPEGAVVRHKCDTPRCCNPRHLLIGTTADNNLDMRTRMRHRYGKRHPAARLTTVAVKTIKRLGYTVTARELAKSFGVAQSTINDVRQLKTWTHVSI